MARGIVRCAPRDRPQHGERGERRRDEHDELQPERAAQHGDEHRDDGGERDRARGRRARRRDLPDRQQDRRRSPRPTQPGTCPSYRRQRRACRVPREARRGRRSAARTPDSGPSRSSRNARMPDRPRALDVVLDRVADHRRLLRRHLEQRRGRRGRSPACGFVLPWWNELMPASTSSPWCAANSARRGRSWRRARSSARRRAARRARAARRRTARSCRGAPSARVISTAQSSAAGSSPPMPRTIRSVKANQTSSSWSSSGCRCRSTSAASRASS